MTLEILHSNFFISRSFESILIRNFDWNDIINIAFQAFIPRKKVLSAAEVGFVLQLKNPLQKKKTIKILTFQLENRTLQLMHYGVDCWEKKISQKTFGKMYDTKLCTMTEKREAEKEQFFKFTWQHFLKKVAKKKQKRRKFLHNSLCKSQNTFKMHHRKSFLS